MKKTILFIAIILISTPLFAVDYYVDAVRGSNDNLGLTPDDAWRTITYCLLHIERSEEDPPIVHVAKGTYAEGNGEDFDFGDLRYSTGIAAVWISPFGALSVSFAAPFNDDEDDETEGFQFNLGQQF